VHASIGRSVSRAIAASSSIELSKFFMLVASQRNMASSKNMVVLYTYSFQDKDSSRSGRVSAYCLLVSFTWQVD